MGMELVGVELVADGGLGRRGSDGEAGEVEGETGACVGGGLGGRGGEEVGARGDRGRERGGLGLGLGLGLPDALGGLGIVHDGEGRGRGDDSVLL